MKLATSIPMRRDGTLQIVSAKGNKYDFLADGADIVADVEDEDDLKQFLLTGNFFPANSEDNAAAVALAGQDVFVEEGADDDADDEPSDPNAPPVEANTPPVTTVKPGKKKAR